MRVRENELIEKIAAALGRRPRVSGELRLGIGDDAALFRPRAGREIILTCDWLLEGTHIFRERHTPDSVGWKCLDRTLREIAEMEATHRSFLLSKTLPVSD